MNHETIVFDFNDIPEITNDINNFYIDVNMF